MTTNNKYTMDFVLNLLHTLAKDIENGNLMDELDLADIRIAIEILTKETK